MLLDKILNELLESSPKNDQIYRTVEDVLNFISSSFDSNVIKNSDEIYKEIDLTDLNLDTSLQSCAAKIYYYGYKENECNTFLEFLDLLLDSREAQFVSESRENHPKNAFKEKEADIKRMLMLDWEYKLLKVLHTSVKLIKSYYTPIVKAYDAQSRLLMSINKRNMFKAESGMS